ncbi:MAG: site-specific integrase [Candidatus Bathyarchaeia archaeon]
MREDIYDFARRIERYRRIIAELGNGDVALRLLDHLASLGLSEAALSNQAAHLIAVLRLIDFDVREATRVNVERVVAKINGNRSWREETKRHKRLVLKRLIQFAKCGSCERGAPVPPEVAWIKVSKKRANDSRVKPEALLTVDDFEALVKATENARDRAMVYTLFEGALRPGELLSMSVGSVEFKDKYCLITVVGKTGLKRIPLVVSYKPLLKWLEEHPLRDDPNAPLWCSLSRNYLGRRLSYRHFRLIIKRLVKKAGLRKEVWPYLFRHTAITKMAKVLTEAQLESYAGWVHGSRMPAKYVHSDTRDVEEAILSIYGIKKVEAESVVKTVKCPRCGSVIPETSRFCSECGLPLSMMTAYKAEMSAKEVVEAAEMIESMKQKMAEQSAEIAELKTILEAIKSKKIGIVRGDHTNLPHLK